MESYATHKVGRAFKSGVTRDGQNLHGRASLLVARRIVSREGTFAAFEIIGVVDAAGTLIVCDGGVWAGGSSAARFRLWGADREAAELVGRWRFQGGQRGRRLAVFDLGIKRADGIKTVRADPTSAMAHARKQEQTRE
jgi:hypothetical protein